MHHLRKTRLKYTKLRSADGQKSECTFCSDPTIPKRTIKQTKTMRLVHIRTKYDVFEGRKVLDHLMIVPKRHTVRISDFTDAEKVDLLTLAGEYEPDGYDTYARGVGNADRSVAHQHTHLIKTVGKRANFFFFIKKPHFLIHR